jgi:hypothetical protein
VVRAVLQWSRGVFPIVLAGGVLVTAIAGTASADAGRTVTSRDLATLRDLSSLSVSPDGTWAAFQVVRADPDRNTYDVGWHVVAIANARNIRRFADGGSLGPFGSGLPRIEFFAYQPPPPPLWSPDSAWIYYLRWDGDRAQIWRAGARSGAAQQLTQGERNVRRFAYTRDGARILYETEPSMAQIRDALAEEGKSGFLFDDKYHAAYDIRPLQSESIAPASSQDLVSGAGRFQSTSRAILTYELGRQRERPATAAEQAEFQTLINPSVPEQARRLRGETATSPGGAMAWMDARDPERQGFEPPATIVARLSDGREAIICSAPQCQNQFLRGLWWRSEDELVFLRAEGPQRMDTGLYAWRLSDGSLRTILRTQAKLLGHISATGSAQSSCAIGSDRLVCSHETPTSPRRLVVIDLDNGAIETLYEPNPDFARFDIGPPPQRLKFRGSSGETYHGFVALPPRRRTNERLPLVVIARICDGFLRGGGGDEYPIYPLAAEGFAVLCFDSPNGEEGSASLDYTAFSRWFWQQDAGRQMFLDALEAAIKHLDNERIIDPDRVGITGLSRGAQHVGWAITSMPRIAAASASGAPGNPGPFYYYLTGHQVRANLPGLTGLGNPNDTAEQWRKSSFSPNVDRVRTPLLINAADHELMGALEPFIELRDAGRAVEMYSYPDEYHWKWQPVHRLTIYNRNIDWMNFWLQGREDSAPAKAEQYNRWRAMRVKQCELFKGPDAPWYCRR